LPLSDRAAAIEKRRSYWWGRDCRFCPDSADAAIYAGPSGLISPPRWLDLCWRHYDELRRVLDGILPWDIDTTVLARYEAWVGSRAAPGHPDPGSRPGRENDV